MRLGHGGQLCEGSCLRVRPSRRQPQNAELMTETATFRQDMPSALAIDMRASDGAGRLR